MIWDLRGFFQLAVICGLSILLMALTHDASARGPGGGARPRAHVLRDGPARSGSFGHASGRERARPERQAERRQRRRPDDRLPAARPRDRPVERPAAPARRPVAREHREERRENRRDYYDDRRDFARGMRYSASWWTRSCSRATIVVANGYSYYRCDDVWFSRTYYGGEVIYTVTDAPSGY